LNNPELERDYLWRYNTQIDQFIAAEQVASEHYCAGTRAWEWESGQGYTLEPGAYDHKLMDFFADDPGRDVHQRLNIMVVIGGIGTGKSTAVRHAWNKASSSPRKCSRIADPRHVCNTPPNLLDIELAGLAPQASRSQKRSIAAHAQASAFWQTVATLLQQMNPVRFDLELECRFWRWCVDKSSISDRSTTVQKWLGAHDFQIRAVTDSKPYAGWTLPQLTQALERAREELFHEMEPQDLAWYRAFQLAFVRTIAAETKCRCRFIILDNVDQLEPEVQREAVDFVILLAGIINARALIAIRPLTWERAFDAHVLVRMENHCAPSFRNVLMTRLSHLEKSGGCPPGAIAHLRALVDELTKEPSLWHDMFEATAGLSVRFALRNFANMTQSPILPAISSTPKPFDSMRASEFARAFFFGDGGTIDTHAFENLYRIGNDFRHGYRLVKMRLLDFTIRIDNGVTSLRRLKTSLEPFGYDDHMIFRALNELFRRSRPLLWSHEGHDSLAMTPSSRIAATPIGHGYYTNLFGQLYYDEVCLASSLRDVVSPERVIAFHNELWDQDEREIRRFVRTQNAHRYLSIYPAPEILGISVVHAQKLRVGFEKRKFALPMGFDPDRDVFLRSRIAELLDLQEPVV
jgi:hypothetical protein